MNSEQYDIARTVYRASSWRDDERIIDGHVWVRLIAQTPHGFVDVHSNTKYGGGDTSLHFVYKGHRYNRYIKQFHQPRYLVTLATRFVNEIMSLQQETQP